MKKTVIFIAFLTLVLRGVSFGQNPYQSIGKEMPKGKMLTLSNGKFQEFFPNDTLVPIGSVMYNTVTGEVVAFLTRDTMYAEYNLEPEVVSRWLSPDPLAGKFTDMSPYVYAGNTPVNAIDPDGRQFILTINYNDKGEISGINISAKVYIKGEGASKERADALNKTAKDVLQSKEVDGINVSFNVSYEYNADITESQLDEDSGENILEFKAENITSDVGGKEYTGKNESFTRPNRIGKVGNSGESDFKVLHETMHFLGLSDRYTEGPKDVNGNRTAKEHQNFQDDIMSRQGSMNFNPYHYRAYTETAQIIKERAEKGCNTAVVNRLIDRDKKGNLKTPK